MNVKEYSKKIEESVLNFNGHNITDKCKSFLSGLLEKNINKRFSLDQAINHPWLVLIKEKVDEISSNYSTDPDKMIHELNKEIVTNEFFDENKSYFNLNTFQPLQFTQKDFEKLKLNVPKNDEKFAFKNFQTNLFKENFNKKDEENYVEGKKEGDYEIFNYLIGNNNNNKIFNYKSNIENFNKKNLSLFEKDTLNSNLLYINNINKNNNQKDNNINNDNNDKVNLQTSKNKNYISPSKNMGKVNINEIVNNSNNKESEENIFLQNIQGNYNTSLTVKNNNLLNEKNYFNYQQNINNTFNLINDNISNNNNNSNFNSFKNNNNDNIFNLNNIDIDFRSKGQNNINFNNFSGNLGNLPTKPFNKINNENINIIDSDITSSDSEDDNDYRNNDKNENRISNKIINITNIHNNKININYNSNEEENYSKNKILNKKRFRDEVDNNNNNSNNDNKINKSSNNNTK
jgi:hypothetical protein